MSTQLNIAILENFTKESTFYTFYNGILDKPVKVSLAKLSSFDSISGTRIYLQLSYIPALKFPRHEQTCFQPFLYVQ